MNGDKLTLDQVQFSLALSPFSKNGFFDITKNKVANLLIMKTSAADKRDHKKMKGREDRAKGRKTQSSKISRGGEYSM